MLDAGSATALSRDLIESSIGSFGQFYRLEKPFVKLGLDPRASHIRNRINLQILTMRIRNLHIRRMRRKNHILKLDRMLRQRVHKIDVELAQEQRVILQNDHDDSQRSLVELLQCLGAGLSGDHVLLDEGEAGDEEFFDFGPLLDLRRGTLDLWSGNLLWRLIAAWHLLNGAVPQGSHHKRVAACIWTLSKIV